MIKNTENIKIMQEDRNLFLTFLNDNIGRMNANSMNCKTLMAALNAGLMALCITNDTESVLWIAMGLTALLYFLDCYYLMLEKNFRGIEKHVIKLAEVDLNKNVLFNFNANKVIGKYTSIKNFMKSLYSPSTLYVYLAVEIALYVTLKLL